jgi:hypothetical protein
MSDSGVVAYTDDKRLGAPHGVYAIDEQGSRLLLPYALARDINSRGDIVLWANGKNWLMHDGLFYQAFDELPFVGQTRMWLNNRGEIVAEGHDGNVFQTDIIYAKMNPIKGDCDDDWDRSLSDFACLQACFTGAEPEPLSETCALFDFDDDSDVDLDDFAAFARLFNRECLIGITTPPNGAGACLGQPVTMNVETRGPVVSYQWYKDGVDIPGATSAEYLIPSVSAAHEGYYGVRLEGPCENDDINSSNRFWVKHFSGPPVLSDQPLSQSACPGADVRFCINLSSPGDFTTFQWQKNGEPIEVDGDWYCFVLREVTIEDSGQYRVAATNPCGTTFSNIGTLTVAPATTPPVISQQPQSATVPNGGYVTLDVTASCVDSYQWYKDGEPIENAILRQHFIFPVTCAHAGAYTVHLTNHIGTTISNPATLTVTGCP